MSKAEDIVIFKKSYELAQDIFKATKLFPRSQRFLMASRLEGASIRLLEYIIQANEAGIKSPHLYKASQLLERLQILIRLSKDSCYIDFRRYERLSKAADEAGRMLGGWIKYMVSKENRF